MKTKKGRRVIDKGRKIIGGVAIIGEGATNYKSIIEAMLKAYNITEEDLR